MLRETSQLKAGGAFLSCGGANSEFVWNSAAKVGHQHEKISAVFVLAASLRAICLLCTINGCSPAHTGWLARNLRQLYACVDTADVHFYSSCDSGEGGIFRVIPPAFCVRVTYYARQRKGVPARYEA